MGPVGRAKVSWGARTVVVLLRGAAVEPASGV